MADRLFDPHVEVELALHLHTSRVWVTAVDGPRAARAGREPYGPSSACSVRIAGGSK